MEKIVLYCRSAIADENAIDVQKKKLISFAKTEGYGECEIYCDNGESGSTFDRPAMNKLNSDIRKGFIKIVVAVDVARICRNIVIFQEWADFLIKYGVRFIAVDDGMLLQ